MLLGKRKKHVYNPKMASNTTYPSDIAFYNYTAIIPADGNCEFKEIGPVGPVKELGNMLFCIATALIGVVGIFVSKNVNLASRYMLSLIFAYGLMSAMYSGTLWNGFLKTAQSILNLFQAIVIVSLASSLKFPPFDVFSATNYGVTILIFGFYPILTHTIASSIDNFWVAWLTYDLIWIIILALGIVIFVYREKYQCYETSPEIFTNIWLAIGSIILAYVFWLLDRFACSFGVAVIYPLGWWYLFNGFGFYYLVTLNAALQAGYVGHTVVVTRWPTEIPHVFVFVNWIKKSILDSARKDDYQSINETSN